MTHVIPFRHFVYWSVAAAAIIASSRAKAESEYMYESVPPGPFHQPVAPYPVEMGFSQDHSSTLAEGAQRGRAAVIQALGNYQLSASQAQILWQQARWLDRENDLKYVQARHAWKDMLHDARVRNRERRNAAIQQGQEKLAQRRSMVYREVYRLPADELDLTTGTINWPRILQAAKFQHDRKRVAQLLRPYVSYGELQPGTAHEIVRCTERLIRSLRADSRKIRREEYLVAQKFLRGLKCEAEALIDA